MGHRRFSIPIFELRNKKSVVSKCWTEAVMQNISGAINFKCSRYSRDSLNQTFLFPKTFTRGSLTSSDKIFRFSIFHSTYSRQLTFYLGSTQKFATQCFTAFLIGRGQAPGSRGHGVLFGIKSAIGSSRAAGPRPAPCQYIKLNVNKKQDVS